MRRIPVGALAKLHKLRVEVRRFPYHEPGALLINGGTDLGGRYEPFAEDDVYMADAGSPKVWCGHADISRRLKGSVWRLILFGTAVLAGHAGDIRDLVTENL